ncbi:MAG: hypothetical protein ABGX33_04485 [Cycloclasticus sp.]
MNWEIITAVSEIIGAAGIIATLIYLSIQVRDNTKTERAASRLIITQDYRKTISHHLDINNASAYREGHWDYPNMPYEDNILFSTMLTDDALLFQGVLAQFESGQLEKETYETYLTWFACLTSTPGGTAWWRDTGKIVFLAHMVSVVEKRFVESGLYDIRQLAQFQRKPNDPS